MRIETKVNLAMAAYLLVVIVIVIAFGCAVHKSVTYVEKVGLKTIFTEIWEGSSDGAKK